MRIGAVAAAAEVNEQTLRFYEREGLVQPPRRLENGYRDYPDETVALVRFIKRAQELGFSLEDARVLTTLRRAPAHNRLRARELAAAKLLEVEQKLADLNALHTALRDLIETCCDSDSTRCPILEALDGSAPHPCVSRHPKGTTR